MTALSSVLRPYNVNETLGEYIERKQTEVLCLVQSAYESGQLDEMGYKRFLLETCEAETFDEAFDHFRREYETLIDSLENNEIQKIQSRLVKGAKMIENETDQVKRQGYLRAYDVLLKKLEALKEGKQ